MSYLENYEIVPEEERALHERKTSTITDPAQRREHKIKQYQKEKYLRARIEVCCFIPPSQFGTDLDFNFRLFVNEEDKFP